MTVHFRWADEDGDPFAVGTWGHVDKGAITRAMVRNWCHACDALAPRRHVVQHLYVVEVENPNGGTEPWYQWCQADAPGARPITAWRPE